MAEIVSDNLLSSLGEFLTARMGLHFPPERRPDLERGIGIAARECGFSDVTSFAEWLLSSPSSKKQVEVLASHLTVGETYFFRQKKSFEMLEDRILPELIGARRDAERRLRIWSAGCATGEEPYSIAISLSRTIPDLHHWNVYLLATDINPNFLRQASQGVYGEWSFRETPEWAKERYFTRIKRGHYQILSPIRKLVTFNYLNLAEDVYPSLLNNTNAMDIVLCRNVLMYFAPERARQVIQKLHRCLVNGGWLVVSPVDVSHALFSGFSSVNISGVTLYRKLGERPSAPDSLATSLTEEPELTSTLPTQSFDELPAQVGRSEGFESEEQPGFDSPAASDYQSPAHREPAALYEQGRYAEAEKEILALLPENSQNANAMALLARAYANQGKLNQALDWCAKAIAADKVNSGFYYLRAMILQEQGRLEEAASSLKRALYLEPDFVLAHFSLGNLARRQGKPTASRKHFRNALSLLRKYSPEEILPDSEGITAGRLTEVISIQSGEEGAVQLGDGTGESAAVSRGLVTANLGKRCGHGPERNCHDEK